MAKLFADFVSLEQAHFKIAALYAETNGFAHNSDEWYFEVFGYKAYGGHEDYDWLAYWDTDAIPKMTLTGMEGLQEAYSNSEFWEDEYKCARDLCDHLVVAKFQDLIRRSRSLVGSLDGPILVTSHGYDYIAEFRNP